jgi:hypothetical protein
MKFESGISNTFSNVDDISFLAELVHTSGEELAHTYDILFAHLEKNWHTHLDSWYISSIFIFRYNFFLLFVSHHFLKARYSIVFINYAKYLVVGFLEDMHSIVKRKTDILKKMSMLRSTL